MPGAEDVPEASPEPEEPEEPEGEPLTVRFESIPDEHDGHSPVVFRLAFSEAPHQFSYQTMRDETLRIWQGEARSASKAKRLDPPSNRRWEVTYQPVSNAAITVALGPTLACTDDGAVCTENGRRLSNTISTVIQGPPGLSVAERSAGRPVRRGLRVLHEFQLQQQAQGGRTSGGRGAGTHHPGTGVDRATDGRGEDFTGLTPRPSYRA